jgi:peptide/nickel transport system substrate-binding protein
VRRLQKRVSLVAPVALLALGAAACGGSSSNSGSSNSAKPNTTATVKQGGTLTFASEKVPEGFNINTSADVTFDTGLQMDPLAPWAFNNTPGLDVALNTDLLDSAELTNKTPQTVVYKIKQNAVWSDGVPITADDFIYNWKHQNGSDPNDDAATTTGYEDIDNIVGSDNGKTVTVTFKNTFGDWKALFSTLLPAHYMEKAGGWTKAIKEAPPAVSGGPYVVSQFVKGNSLTLVRNDKYYGKRPALDQIVYRYITDSAAEPQALANNEVQMIYPQPQLDLIDQVKKIQGVKTETNLGLNFEHIDFNFKNSLLADIAVRKAIATGIDRQELLNATVKQFTDKAAVLNNRMFMPSQKGYQDNAGGISKGDIAGAQKLLDAAGYTKGPDGIYAKNGQPLKFRYTVTQGNKLRERTEEIFIAQMKKVGIAVDPVNTTKLGSTLSSGDFDIIQFGWVGTPFPVSSNQSIYLSTGGQNYGKFVNADVDKLFPQAIREVDPQKANDTANQIDKILFDQMATLPLYQKPTFLAYYDRYANIVDNPTSQGPFYNVQDWGLKG